MNEVVKYIFFFLIGTTVLNFGIAIAARCFTKSKEFNQLTIYWTTLFINFFIVAALSATPNQIAFAFFFQFIPTFISGNILMQSRGKKLDLRLYGGLHLAACLLGTFLLLKTNAGFTLSLLPVAVTSSLVLFIPMWNSLVTHRSDANWIEKAMALMFVTAVINLFNYPLFRLDESTAWWGWSLSIAQYQCLSIFLPLLINYRRSQIERKNLELALNKLSAPIGQQNIEIDELYRNLELQIGQKEEVTRKLQASNQSLEEEREINEILIKTVSHDLANPLTVINAYIDMLHAGKIPLEDRDMIWERIKMSTRSALDMISRIRDAIVTRTQASIVAIHDVSVDRSIQRLIQQFETHLRSKNIKLSYESNIPLDIFVSAEENTLTEHVFSNILSNAIKFSFDNSEIKITVSQVQDGISVEFKDSGMGIAQDRLGKRLLHSTEGTRGESGSGFGVMVMSYYLRKFDATYSIHSEGKNKGTTVTVNLKKSSTSLSKYGQGLIPANNFS